MTESKEHKQLKEIGKIWIENNFKEPNIQKEGNLKLILNYRKKEKDIGIEYLRFKKSKKYPKDKWKFYKWLHQFSFYNSPSIFHLIKNRITQYKTPLKNTFDFKIDVREINNYEYNSAFKRAIRKYLEYKKEKDINLISKKDFKKLEKFADKNLSRSSYETIMRFIEPSIGMHLYFKNFPIIVKPLSRIKTDVIDINNRIAVECGRKMDEKRLSQLIEHIYCFSLYWLNFDFDLFKYENDKFQKIDNLKRLTKLAPLNDFADSLGDYHRNTK